MNFRCVRCKREIDKTYRACPHCGEPVTEFQRRYADEPVDGKYQIVERLGAGGMGEVYKVTHILLGTTRVIKVIRPQISESTDAHDRFLREARTATKIQHTNVATLHDFAALPDGSHYMVWEYIDGENLAQRIRARGTLQPRYAVMIAIQALQGLEAIHQAGIVHRDISPENIMITRDRGGEEHVKVIDLGVAKSEDSGDFAATRTGIFVGKLRYASPEHLGFLNEGEKIDGRADVYSMGMVLYEMLTGRPPFEASTPHEYVLMHSRDTQMKPMTLPANLPGGTELQAAVARSLERDRNKRYNSAREFAAVLEAVESTLPDPTAIRTMAESLPDMEATMQQTPLPAPDTLHRSTVRSAVAPIPPPPPPAAETMRTPFPGGMPAAAQPQPQPQPQVVQPQVVARPKKGSTIALVIVAFVLLAGLGGIAFVLLRSNLLQSITGLHLGTGAATATTPVQPARPVTPAPATAPQATVDVTPPAAAIPTASIIETETTAQATTSAPAPTATAASAPTATVAPPKPKPVVVEKPKPVETPEEEQPAPAPAPVTVRTYTEGGDSDANEKAIASLRQQIQGTTRVALRGNSDMLNDLANTLRQSGITVSESADVVINFYGTIERMGLGRKRRSAHVTVLKNDRPIFKYELPSQDYRVGDTPAEAFARVFSDAVR